MLRFVIFALLLAPVARAGEGPAAEAWALVEAEKYEEAEAAYKALTKAEPDEGKHWHMLGYTHLAQGEAKKALKVYDKALAKGADQVRSHYNIACAHALLGAPDEAFAALETALEAGFDGVDHLREDGDLSSLHADARWAGVVERADRAAHPCAYDEAMADFDFWLGTWEVEDAHGKVIGRNTIEKAHGGCVVVEHWEDGHGNTGTSMSYHDPATEQWVQVWRGSKGMIGEYRGALDGDGVMALEGPTTAADGTTWQSRGAWTSLEDGTVVQRFEKSKDGGETWEKSYDLTYHPVE